MGIVANQDHGSGEYIFIILVHYAKEARNPCSAAVSIQFHSS